MAGCKFSSLWLWIGDRGPFFLGRMKSANLNIFAKTTTVQHRHFHFLNFVVFFIACFVLWYQCLIRNLTIWKYSPRNKFKSKTSLWLQWRLETWIMQMTSSVNHSFCSVNSFWPVHFEKRVNWKRYLAAAVNDDMSNSQSMLRKFWASIWFLIILSEVSE